MSAAQAIRRSFHHGPLLRNLHDKLWWAFAVALKLASGGGHIHHGYLPDVSLHHHGHGVPQQLVPLPQQPTVVWQPQQSVPWQPQQPVVVQQPVPIPQPVAVPQPVPVPVLRPVPVPYPRPVPVPVPVPVYYYLGSRSHQHHHRHTPDYSLGGGLGGSGASWQRELIPYTHQQSSPHHLSFPQESSHQEQEYSMYEIHENPQ